tara:strand:- start:90 stop:755 length:666 start_codon:yes stop_codon:yes gene_type:complete
MEVIIAVDDIHPEPGWGCEGDKSVEYLEELNKEFGCKFTLFVPSNYHGEWPISLYKDWVEFWKYKDWIELAAHGHFHACDRTDIGECEFLELETDDRIKTRLGMCLAEWRAVDYMPLGWRNPGWVANHNAVKHIGKYFKYAALHKQHNHNIKWDCKMFFGCDGINEEDNINLYNNTFMFQSHIAGDWNDNCWNKNNYNNFRNILLYLLNEYKLNFTTFNKL